MPVDSLHLTTSCYAVQGTRFDVASKYSVLEPLGQGSYGIVCAAKNLETDEFCAVKKIENVFEHVAFTKRTLRELRILRLLQSSSPHENIIHFTDLFISGTKHSFEDIYVVSGLMETDLASIIASKQPLSDEHTQFFLYQVLRGIKFVHSARVVHRDLKPRNLLVNANCDLKICDFGLSRVIFEPAYTNVTEYICTRWYRAPEALCSWTTCSFKLDLWSIGCILAEMVNCVPIFPGRNTQHQLELILECLGTPSAEEIAAIPSHKCRLFIESLHLHARKPLKDVVNSSSVLLVNLLGRLLEFNPDRRCTAEQALSHEYLDALSCPEDEPTRDPIDPADFEFERRRLPQHAVREEFFQEIMRYYPDLRSQYLAEEVESGNPYDVRSFPPLAEDGSNPDDDLERCASKGSS
eukprot:TRINITY_DN55162_c0_g1_i1.p1 TRINITY_DN55162_c0_g1~~TRINITY_DN55162_c0_g1_i1.p1  ORF type:complete len:409 (-),score=53.78 TRINITY_DN55162_c0_g1_i1:120-1346(-)